MIRQDPAISMNNCKIGIGGAGVRSVAGFWRLKSTSGLLLLPVLSDGGPSLGTMLLIDLPLVASHVRTTSGVSRRNTTLTLRGQPAD